LKSTTPCRSTAHSRTICKLDVSPNSRALALTPTGGPHHKAAGPAPRRARRTGTEEETPTACYQVCAEPLAPRKGRGDGMSHQPSRLHTLVPVQPGPRGTHRLDYWEGYHICCRFPRRGGAGNDRAVSAKGSDIWTADLDGIYPNTNSRGVSAPPRGLRRVAAEKEDAIRFGVVCLAVICSCPLWGSRVGGFWGSRVGGFWESKALSARSYGWLGRIAHPTPGTPTPDLGGKAWVLHRIVLAV
jgi:hypothetical protein